MRSESDSLMHRQLHGVLSLALIAIAVLAGFFAILLASPAFAIIYLGLGALSAIVILVSYCAKCPHRDTSCSHVIPGRIAGMLPKREGGRYTASDYAGVVISLLFLVLTPQYWLVANPPLLVIFWVSLVTGIIDIRCCVCRGCGNAACPLCEEECTPIRGIN